MSKELDALEHIYYGSQGYGETDKYYKFLKEFLEAIENANPSEALSAFRSVELTLKENRLLNDGGWLIDDINTIKQSLLKAQENEKVLEIIKNKSVNMIKLEAVIMIGGNANDYNKNEEYQQRYLTQEEFDTLKRYFKLVVKE